ncbi:sigma-70 family RNA polymerase sigma factor [bacterium]|nr:sigma-70 family RNA polymerase sigma factor [bacterium]
MTAAEYNKMVDMYADNLYRFVVKNIRNTDVAQDIVQETFEKMWKKVDEISNDTAKAYLFQTGYRTMIDVLRKDRRITDLTEMNENHFVSENSFSDLHEVLQKAVATLPEIQRSVLMLRDYEGYSYEEIGEITGLNESQVKVYIFRARKTLKKYIGNLEAVV